MTNENIKQAPQWFLHKQRQVQQLRKEVAALLDVGEGWIEQRIESGKDFGSMAERLDDNDKEKLGILTEHAEHLVQGGWARFRYENIDNRFGHASKLEFNEEDETIEIHRSMFQKAIEKLEEIADDLNLGLERQE